jgi:hypothetical protein
MKILLKIYSASCAIVLAFFLFFSLPLGLLPFSDAVNVMVVGSAILALTGFYTFYFYRREGLELGWFLANRGGLWVITLAAFGIVLLICGMLLFVSPEDFVPALEQGALPFGIMIVSLFWLALIFMFGYLSFGMVAKATVNVRVSRFGEAATYALIALVCLALAGVFFSLYLQVINDIAIRISVPYQWNAIWVFVGLLVVVGVVYGMRVKRSEFLDKERSS